MRLSTDVSIVLASAKMWLIGKDRMEACSPVQANRSATSVSEKEKSPELIAVHEG